jgi:NADP-dependent 3-hydroxy acid dehydrogenase YdfG
MTDGPTAIARELVREGSRLVLAARFPEKLEEVMGEIEALGGSLPTDVTDRAQRGALVATAEAGLGVG